MTRVSRTVEKGETQGFMKIAADAEDVLDQWYYQGSKQRGAQFTYTDRIEALWRRRVEGASARLVKASHLAQAASGR